MALFGFGYKKKLEDVRKKLDAGEYQAAALAADEIPLQKVKSAHDLNLLGKAYKSCGEFIQARDIFERSYEMRCSRTVLMDVMDCCLEVRDLDGVEKYFDEYHKVAPEDKVTQYKYRYRIEKKKERERRLLITILEELKALEYTEEYAYELAKQYHKAGLSEECMNECNDIILWFGFGPTVERAKTLLAYYKGEISIEEIRSAGMKYQAELERQWLEEKQAAKAKKELEAVVPEAAAAQEAEPEDMTELETEAAPEAEPEDMPEAEPVWEAEPEVTEPEAALETEDEFADTRTDGYAEEEEEEDFFELPEIDLSGMGFEEEDNYDTTEHTSNAGNTEPAPVREYQRSATEEEEYYALAPVDIVIPNKKLASLVAERQVSLTEVLNNFGRIERIRKQVLDSLEPVLNDRNKAYFVITGETQTGKTTLALAMIRLMYELGIVKYDRTATINAVQLNQVVIEDYGEELKNCNLIIENAGGMTKESIEGLIRFSRGNKGKTCVILEDSIRSINKFFKAREELGSMFSNRVNLGKYNAEELMGFAYDYIKKEDYSLDKAAAEILKDKIDEIVKEYNNDQRLVRTLRQVEVIMARAEKRTGELLLEMATEGKIQQGNYLVILPEDVAL